MSGSKKPIIPKRAWDKKRTYKSFKSKFLTVGDGVVEDTDETSESLRNNGLSVLDPGLCEAVCNSLLECGGVVDPGVLKGLYDKEPWRVIYHPSFIRTGARRGVVFYIDSTGSIRYQTSNQSVKVGPVVSEEGVDPNYFVAPSWYGKLEAFVAAGSSVLLIGPAGVGKSEAVERLFVKRNQRLLIVSCNPSQTADDFEGVTNLVETESGGMMTEFAPAAPAVALENGFGLLLDEADAAPPEACYALYRVIDGRSMEILRKGYDGSISRHEDFRVIGTQNTEGRGDVDGLFHGRALQDEAFLDRWECFIRVDYPTVDREALIITKRVGLPKNHAYDVAKAANVMRKALSCNSVMTSVSMRRTLAVSKNLVAGMTRMDAWLYSVLNRANSEDRQALVEALTRVYGNKLEKPLGDS